MSPSPTPLPSRVATAVLLAAAILLPASNARAVVLVSYTFPDGPSNLAATTTDSSVTAGNVGFGTGNSQFSVSGDLGLNIDLNAKTAPTAISTQSYFEFSVTPKPNFLISFSSLTFDAAKSDLGSTSGVVVRSSADNFATDLLSQTIPVVYPTHTPMTVNLTGAAFQNLSSATTFRFYSFASAGNNPTHAYDNITLSGPSAAVPEPAEWGVTAGLGLAAFGLWRRRQG